jgi:hypothetical protein
VAKLFDSYDRIVPTWLAAARHLNQTSGRTAMNLVLEIAKPLEISAADRLVMQQVDKALGARGLTLRTVAGTIFPLDVYRRYGRPQFYDRYKEMLKRGKAPGTWGTYAMRMIDRAGREPGTRINPLDTLIGRLSEAGQPQKPAGGKKSFVTAYELGVADPEQDLAIHASNPSGGGDVPTYDPAIDGNEWMGFPCLSHVTFKRVPTEKGHRVNLTAVYRSHHYCARALGNLIGLAQLLSFVATEAGLEAGTLTCLSSYAELDVGKWGGAKAAASILT